MRETHFSCLLVVFWVFFIGDYLFWLSFIHLCWNPVKMTCPVQILVVSWWVNMVFFPWEKWRSQKICLVDFIIRVLKNNVLKQLGDPPTSETAHLLCGTEDLAWIRVLRFCDWSSRGDWRVLAKGKIIFYKICLEDFIVEHVQNTLPTRLGVSPSHGGAASPNKHWHRAKPSKFGPPAIMGVRTH